MNDTTISASLATIRASIHQEKELEYFLIHQDRYAYVLSKIFSLSLPEKAKILDIGCYPPHLFHVLEKFGYDMYGISSKHEKLHSKQVVSVNIEHEKIPYPDNSFDVILFFEIIEHLLVNPTIYLSKMYKLLKPGGMLLISTPNVIHLKNRMRLLFGKNIYFPLFQLYDTGTDGDTIYYRHNREYTMGELEEILQKSQFTIHHNEYFSAYTPFRKKLHPEKPLSRAVKLLGYYLTQLYPSFKDSLYIEAKK